MKFKLLLILLALMASTASAASVSSIAVNVAPPNPAPFENTTITLSSYANNLDSVTITWFVNGQNVLSGVGRRTISVDAPAAGSQTTVRFRVALPEGEIENSVIIKPNNMTLLWQATDSYVPPFYKGKALPVADSEIKVVAMPEVKNVSAKSMVYEWKKDYENEAGASGYGKNYFTYINDYLENVNNIAVTAATTDNSSSSEANINIGTILPQISFYREDANLGTIWESTVENGHIISGEEVIVAVPYFIAPKEIAHPVLSWNWMINGNPIGITGIQKHILPIKAETGVSGTSSIRLEIENGSKIFQSANKEINVQF